VTDGLSGAIVNIARLMRHDGIRLVVGTQSPRALAPELLELVTVAVIHRFH
jgi:DNA helicase HerA-like ATPase